MFLTVATDERVQTGAGDFHEFSGSVDDDDDDDDSRPVCMHGTLALIVSNMGYRRNPA